MQEQQFAVVILKHGRPTFVSQLLSEEEAEKEFRRQGITVDMSHGEEIRIVSAAESRMFKRMMTEPLTPDALSVTPG